MKYHFIAICLYVVTTNAGLTTPIALHVDNTHSSIQFSVPFLGISEVTGRFEKFCGHFYFDEANMEASSLELFIDASSINTGLKVRDRDLVEKYLESKTYPIMYYKSKSIRFTKAKQFDVIGELRLHGVTKELRITLSSIGDIINSEKARELGLKLQPLKINRTDYGIMEGSFGSGSVGDTVMVSAIIRVRDVTPYRKDIDERYPEKNSRTILPFAGIYTGKAGARIELISDGGNYFLSFADEEWSWFAQAKRVGPDLFKLLSFSKLVQLTPTGLTFTQHGEEPESFTKIVKN